MDTHSDLPERRERQVPSLWFLLLPLAIVAIVAFRRSHFATHASADAHDAVTDDAHASAVPITPADDSARDARTAITVPTAHTRTAARPPAVAAPLPLAVALPRQESGVALGQDADDALRADRVDDAYNLAAACLRHDPADPRCLRIAAIVTMRGARFDDARPYVDACMESAPDDPQCLTISAQLALHDRDLTLAGILSWRLSQLAPDNVDTLMARAQLADLQGDPAAAERSYRRACQAGQASACQRLGELTANSAVQ